MLEALAFAALIAAQFLGTLHLIAYYNDGPRPNAISRIPVSVASRPSESC